jgi:hypothetical protein
MKAFKAYICKEKNYVFADVLSPQKQLGPQTANPQIAKNILSASRKSAKCYICGRSANLSKKIVLKFCGTYFADRPRRALSS